MKNNIGKDEIFKIFCWGVDYGQLLMEEERDGEEFADAFQGMIISEKYNSPAQISPRRQSHSEKWRNAKRNSYKEFLELYINTNK